MSMEPHQYSLRRILVLWLAAALPMGLAAWVALPVLVTRVRQPSILVYWVLVIFAMLWQLALSLWLVYRETGNLRWDTLRRRTWLNAPRDPRTGQPRPLLFGWLLPFVLIAGVSLGIVAFLGTLGPPLLRLVNPSADVSVLNSLSYLSVLDWASPEFSGDWWLLGLVFLIWLLSSFLAEEFFFRGVLLPKMQGAFGSRDWLANAILFGLYHLDKPWTIPLRLIESLAIVAPARYFRSNWMAVIARAAEGVFLFVVVLLGITTPLPPPLPASLNLPHIDTRPYAFNWRRGTLRALPSFDPNSPESFQVDLRSYDLSAFDLRDAAAKLVFADFDTRTQWPPRDRMPADFDPAQILEMGKNPGLGIRDLHAQGITGRGVGIAIIDQALLTEHQEYADQLRWYEELNSPGGSMAHPGDSRAQMHGAAVASIAVGKTVGVAPEADLYFIAPVNINNNNQYAYVAEAIRRILQINQTLPAGRKIRVISMSLGFNPSRPGYSEIVAAIREAEAQGLLCIYTSVFYEEGVGYQGLGRSPLADPDAFTSYGPGLFWAPEFYAGRYAPERVLFAPMDARTTASWTGKDDYSYYRTGGMSWPTPYVAGVYALAAQVDPRITPNEFWTLALKTGRTISFTHDGQPFTLGPIIDPGTLIKALRAF